MTPTHSNVGGGYQTQAPAPTMPAPTASGRPGQHRRNHLGIGNQSRRHAGEETEDVPASTRRLYPVTITITGESSKIRVRSQRLYVYISMNILGGKLLHVLNIWQHLGFNVRVGRRRKRLDISLGGDRWSRLVWNYHILALVHPTRKVEMSALDCKCRLIYHMVFNANLFEAVCNVTGKESLNFCVKCEYPPQIEQK